MIRKVPLGNSQDEIVIKDTTNKIKDEIMKPKNSSSLQISEEVINKILDEHPEENTMEDVVEQIVGMRLNENSQVEI